MLMKRQEVREDLDPQETQEWIEALDQVLDEAGPERARFLLEQLQSRASEGGAALASQLTTPYLNTIPVSEEVPYPGDRQLERKIKSIIRWNAMVMVGEYIALCFGCDALCGVGERWFWTQ